MFYLTVFTIISYNCWYTTIVSKQRMKIRAEFITSVLCVYKIYTEIFFDTMAYLSGLNQTRFDNFMLPYLIICLRKQ